MAFKVPNKLRIRNGPLGSTDAIGNNGAFLAPARLAIAHKGVPSLALHIIASDGGGWEHVSVSTPRRCPTWAEMCYVKELFWAPEDTVIQFHPPKAEYVNNHPYCLHLWRPVGIEVPLPPSLMVGYAEKTPCGKCHLRRGERCDICGAVAPL